MNDDKSKVVVVYILFSTLAAVIIAILIGLHFGGII